MEQCGGSSAIQKICCEFEANLDHTVRETGVKISKMCEFEKLQTPSPWSYLYSFLVLQQFPEPVLPCFTFSLVCVHVCACMSEDVRV